MVAAGNAPDVVDCSYDKYWPTPLTGGLLQPWDGIIDFNTPLWADTKEITEANMWKGKTYFPVISEFMTSWFYYNKNMFKNYGLEDQSPRALWEKGEWTLDKMIELSDQFIEKNNKKPAERTPVNRSGSFSVGDRVRSANYGEGTVTGIETRDNGNRVLTIQFKGRTAKFIEAFAALEKI